MPPMEATENDGKDESIFDEATENEATENEASRSSPPIKATEKEAIVSEEHAQKGYEHRNLVCARRARSTASRSSPLIKDCLLYTSPSPRDS